ncbi:MAG: 50S ribosomal protein L9 [Clostridiales bacterium]|jgi:large subunit ribosomal protein L9|nr:50S ribosomal protein L9 [Clostridiales bacterium]
MKVILQADIKGKGKKGQVMDVSDGYARNYLLPRKLAVPADTGNLNILKQQEAAQKAKRDKERSDALEIAERLKSCVIIVPAKAGSEGRLFGSVTSQDISEALSKQHGIEIDRHKITIDENIKQLGTFEIKAKLFADVTATLFVTVKEE